jgi:hypothetical protein
MQPIVKSTLPSAPGSSVRTPVSREPTPLYGTGSGSPNRLSRHGSRGLGFQQHLCALNAPAREAPDWYVTC